MSVPAGSDRDADLVAAELVERFRPRLAMFAQRRLGDAAAAEDAVQDTLSRVLVALREGRVRDLQALPAYLYEVLRHVCAHHVRSAVRGERAGTRLMDIMDASSHQTSPLSALIAADDVRRLRTAIATLPADDQAIVRLTWVEGLKDDAIGERLGLSPGNVRVRRHRLKKILAERMGVMSPGQGALERRRDD